MVLCHQNFDHIKSNQPKEWHFNGSSSDNRCGIYIFKDKTASETNKSYRRQVSGRRPTKRISKPKPVSIPAGLKLLRLTTPVLDCPQPQSISNELWRIVQSKVSVPREIVNETAYSYGNGKKAYRIEWPDENNPKGHDKTYRQSHIDSDGKEDWTKGDAAWSAYRIDEVTETLEDLGVNEAVAVLELEGEPNVELARLHGIVGLTFQGSNWTEAQVVAVVEALQATGKNVTLVVLRDNDVPGIKKAELIKSVCDHLQFPCIVIDPVAIYPDIPDKGDIKEILDNMDADELIRRLEEEIHRQAAESARAHELDHLEDDDTPDIKKISLKEAAALAQEILKANSTELAANLELEELRAIIGMNSYDWEHKIIRPIKKDLDLERYKSELLYIMAIADPVERDWRIAQIAPKYQLQRAVIERNIVQMKERTTTPESRLWSLSEVFNLQSEGLQWIIPELLPCAETVILSACPKAGKSLLAVDLAFCMATGEEKFLGQNIKVGKVLLVSVDESLNSTRSKLLKRGFRLQDNDNIKVLPQWDITQTAKLETFLEDYRPDVVIIDSLKRICKGSAVSENSAEFSDNIYALKELLTRYGAAGVLIHHSNKNADALGVDRLRGSSAIAGSVWGVWQVDHIPKKDPNNSKKLIIDPKDPKRIFSCFPRDAEGQTLDIELNLENNSWICHGLAGEEVEAAQQRETIRERILRTLEKHNRPLPGPEIIELIELTEKRASVYSELNRMVGKKVISATPAPDNKRFTLYSLPNCQAEFLSAKASPPPPPPNSLPIAIYESENLIEQGVQINSKIDTRYIAIDSTVTVESEMLSTANDCEDRISEIDSFLPLSHGGGEVKCVSVCNEPQPSEQVLIAPLESKPTEPPIAPMMNWNVGERVKVSAQYPTQEYIDERATVVKVWPDGLCRIELDREISVKEGKPTKQFNLNGRYLVVSEKKVEPTEPIAQPVPPHAPTEPSAELNEDELNLVEMIRIATAEPDAEIARQAAANIVPVLRKVCGSGAANREKVWAALTKSERAIFSELTVKPIVLSDSSQEPEPPQPAPEPEIIAPADAEKLREIASIWWDEFYSGQLQNLISQMFGWKAPGTKYSREVIGRWLEGEDSVVGVRLDELWRMKHGEPLLDSPDCGF
jgi:hypothetical protein